MPDDSPSATPGWASACSLVRFAAAASADAAEEFTHDRLLITERIARYGWAYDERDRAALTDCFTVDGSWEGSLMGATSVGPFSGRDAVADFLAGFWDVQVDQRRHLFTNVVLSLASATQATAHAYLLLTSAAGGRMTPVSSGPYRFELVKEPDGIWRMRLLSAGFDAPF